MGMNVSFKWDKPPAAIANRIISPDVKLFAAATWHKLYSPFVPMGDTGQLMSNVAYLMEGSMGVVHHTVPYAHYQYNGQGFNFRQDKHSLASAMWDQAARAAGKGEELAKGIEAYIGR